MHVAVSMTSSHFCMYKDGWWLQEAPKADSTKQIRSRFGRFIKLEDETGSADAAAQPAAPGLPPAGETCTGPCRLRAQHLVSATLLNHRLKPLLSVIRQLLLYE